MEDRYQYAPLNYSTKEVRLVRILYTDQDAQSTSFRPRLALKHVDLDASPVYQALSYTWGSPSEVEEIDIDGKICTIRSNLCEFLRQKAQDRDFCESAEHWLWIDQISINQEAIEERNHQVEQMSNIYSQAKRVVIWLGPGTEETDRAMACLKNGRNWSHGNREDHMLCSDIIASLGYWKRLWIIQELALAYRTVLICGTKQIRWSDLALHGADADGADSGLAKRKRASTQASSAMSSLIEFRGAIGRGSSCTWKQGLQISREAQCEDPRDRVYGMLSLLQPALRIPVDYTLTVEGLFWSVLNSQVEGDKPRKFEWDWHQFRTSNSRQLFNGSEIQSASALAQDLAYALGLPLSLARTARTQGTLARERFRGARFMLLDTARTALYVIGNHTIPEDLHKMLRAEYRHWRYGSESG